MPADGHLLDQSARVLPVKPIEPQQADIGKTRPGRLELGPEGHEHEYRQSPDPVDRKIEQLKRRGIGPMHVLADNQHRLLPCQTLKLVEKGQRMSVAAAALDSSQAADSARRRESKAARQ